MKFIFIPEIYKLLEIPPFDINTKEDFQEALLDVVGRLDIVRENLPSWKPGFDPKFNVTYRIINERLETLDFEYGDAKAFGRFFDEEISKLL